MSKNVLWIGRIACAALLAIPLIAGQKAVPASNSGKVNSTQAERSAWPPETLTGKITMVDPAEHLVVVQDADGVPFDMVVTHATQIRSGNQRLNLGSLTPDAQKTVTLRFVPERRGDVARSIQLNG